MKNTKAIIIVTILLIAFAGGVLNFEKYIPLTQVVAPNIDSSNPIDNRFFLLVCMPAENVFNLGKGLDDFTRLHTSRKCGQKFIY